jgi:heme d1 biosynthesis radical SAM protein NirJ
MFRITHLLQAMKEGRPAVSRKPPGPVVIWNLIRRCNLRCRHCYSSSLDIDFEHELSYQQVINTIDDLKVAKVPVIIFSGGEPLLRPDIFDIVAYAKKLNFYVALSTNGTLINESNIDKIAQANFDYVGISIDGLATYHDNFRRVDGCFEQSMHAITLCKKAGIKVGMRLCLTQDNAHELPQILELMEHNQVDKFYLSHLNYAGRGKRNAQTDAIFSMTRQAMYTLFEKAWYYLEQGIEKDFVTGNNDADGPLMLQWVTEKFGHSHPEYIEQLIHHLIAWGGNASGVNVANIDNVGDVHPDTYWWNHTLGNVTTEKFSTLWHHSQDPLMLGFRQSPRPVKGRCAACQYLAICNGNTRTRAFAQTGDAWAEDPGCYLTDQEIGVTTAPVPSQTIATTLL